MKENEATENKKELSALCALVRECAHKGEYQNCKTQIFDAMRKYPHAPQPHNLLGVLLEKEGDHPVAMKHFRAAWALDPTYYPARQNLDSYGTFFSSGKCAFDESDCLKVKHEEYITKYDVHGVGHIVRR